MRRTTVAAMITALVLWTAQPVGADEPPPTDEPLPSEASGDAAPEPAPEPSAEEVAADQGATEAAPTEPQPEVPTPAEPTADEAASEEIAADESAPTEPAPETDVDVEVAAAPAASSAGPVATRTVTDDAATPANGALTIQITSPTDGQSFPPGQGPSEITGSVGVGTLGVDVSILYVIDTSGSTDNEDGLDCNGDGVVDAKDDLISLKDSGVGSILDCEVAGMLAINDSLPTEGVVVGALDFDSDVEPQDGDAVLPGIQLFVPPDNDADNSGEFDLLEFMQQDISSSGGTDFDDALLATANAFATRPADERKIAFFFSDGKDSGFDAATDPGLAALAAAGVQVNTFSVGDGSTGCGPDSDLFKIAQATGGICTEVVDPSQLSTIAADLAPVGIDRVEISINGGPPQTAEVDVLGNFTLQVDPSIWKNGPNTVQATGFADDEAQTSASASVTFTVGEVAVAALQSERGRAAAAPATLPVTGASEVRELVLSSLLMILLGAGAVALGHLRTARRVA